MSLQQTLYILFIAMLPYIELRGAIPAAMALGASPGEAFVVSLIGNIIPVIPLIFFLPYLARWADRNPVIDRFFRWLVAKVGRKKHRINQLGAIGLAVFVAIPLPMTGAWSGTMLAFLLGIRKRYAFPAIAAGTLVAGIIVTIISTGAFHLF